MTTTTNTATAPLSTVIGVFPNHEQADRAIDELRHTNFRYERIRVVERGTGGFGETLKSMFTGQASMASSTADSLVKMGMPEYEAQHYQQELDTDHVLLLMNADDRPEEAFSIMRQNGAFDINSRLRLTPADASVEAPYANNGSQATYNQNVPPAPPALNIPPFTPNTDTASATRDSKNAQTAYDPATPQNAQTAYDPNVSPTSANPDGFPEQAQQGSPRNA